MTVDVPGTDHQARASYRGARDLTDMPPPRSQLSAMLGGLKQQKEGRNDS
jgi:hypothetical protein